MSGWGIALNVVATLGGVILSGRLVLLVWRYEADKVDRVLQAGWVIGAFLLAMRSIWSMIP